jgi:hypothetical protein
MDLILRDITQKEGASSELFLNEAVTNVEQV